MVYNSVLVAIEVSTRSIHAFLVAFSVGSAAAGVLWGLMRASERANRVAVAMAGISGAVLMGVLLVSAWPKLW